jgi:hypothetical protein
MSETDLNEELNSRMGLTTAQGMVEQVSYMIFGAAVTTTRAFSKVVVKIEPEVNRIFVSITLRWPFQDYKKFEILRQSWLKRAEERCQEQVPPGWKLLCYYTKGT